MLNGKDLFNFQKPSKHCMLEPSSFSNIADILYTSLWIFIVLLSIVVIYSITPKKLRPFSGIVILLFITFLSMLVIPESYLWLLMPIFWAVFLSLIINVYLSRWYRYEEDKILVDRIPTIWERFDQPPELKIIWEKFSSKNAWKPRSLIKDFEKEGF